MPRRRKKSSSKPQKFRNLPDFFEQKVQFRESMRIAPSLVFRRYMEDVAEDFHDIRRCLPVRNALTRCRAIETTMAVSVRSKLDRLIPNPQTLLSTRRLDQRSIEIFRELSDALFEAELLRSYVLYLVNRLYEVLGVNSLSAKYRDRIHDIPRQYEERLGPAVRERIEDGSSILKHVRDVLAELEFVNPTLPPGEILGAVGRLNALVRTGTVTLQPYLLEMCKFAAFIASLQLFAQSRSPVRVFLSYRRSIPASEQAKDTLRVLTRTHFKDRLRALVVADLAPGDLLRKIVRAAIWYADAVVALFPAVPPLQGRPPYDWITRESEYGILLEKGILFGLEDSANRDDVKAALSDQSIDLLVNGSKIPPKRERMDRLLEAYSEQIRARFPPSSPPGPALDDFKQQALPFLQSLYSDSVREHLEDFIGSFEPANRYCLIALLDAMESPGRLSRSAIASRLVERSFYREPETAKRAFGDLWRSIKDRSLFLPPVRHRFADRPVGLIEIRGRGPSSRYTQRLGYILSCYFPEDNRTARLQLRRSWVQRWRNKWSIRTPV